MVYLPDCVKQINLKIVTKCSDFLNKTIQRTPMAPIKYEIKNSWQFNLLNLATTPNEYTIETFTISEIGYMLLYSFDSNGGQISIDSSSGVYPDFNISNGSFNGYVSAENQNYRFAVLLQIEAVEKTFRFYLNKAYAYPGIYSITPFLQGIPSPHLDLIVSDGDLIL